MTETSAALLVVSHLCLAICGGMMIGNLREIVRPSRPTGSRVLTSWIPIWKLFVPADVMYDYCLLARSRSSDAWAAICQPKQRHWRQLFWNPNAEMYKYVANCAAAIEYDREGDSKVSALARRLLHEFAVEQIGTQEAEVMCVKNIGVVVDGVYYSHVAHVFTITTEPAGR